LNNRWHKTIAAQLALGGMAGDDSLSTQSLAQSSQKVNIDRVLERLERLRKTRRGWIACCPSHPDKNPSLSVAIGNDGRILLYCWSGCSYRQIMAALGLSPGDLMPERPRTRTPEEHQAAAEQAREREIEQALEASAEVAWRKLLVLRRACFLVLDEPDTYYCDLMDYCDAILDKLQLGSLADKLEVMRAAKAGKLGLPGMVIVA